MVNTPSRIPFLLSSLSHVHDTTDHSPIPRFDFIMTGLKTATRKQVFRQITARIGHALGLDRQDLMLRLLDRERDIPSGIGEGLAIASLTVRGIERPHTLLACLEKSAHFDAPDGVPVDTVCLTLFPQNNSQQQDKVTLQTLARLSRFLRDKELRQRLRGAENPGAAEAVLLDTSLRKAA